jgi:hypothetical protein
VSDDLAIGAPGATSVVTTRLEEAADRLEALHGELDRYRRELAILDRVTTAGALARADAPLSAMDAEHAIDDAVAGLGRSAGASEQLARAVERAAGRYQFTESLAARASQAIAAMVGYDAGFLLPVLALAALAGLTATGQAFALTLATLPPARRDAVLAGLSGWMDSHRALLSDPRIVELVRLSAVSTDDFGDGALHVPFAVSRVLGDEGLGLLGLDTSAAVVAGAASGFGPLRETPVTVRALGTRTGGAPPSGLEDRARRIPTDGAQVRIDRISAPGRADRFEVYLAGTADFSLRPGADPWDMTSNVTAVAGGSAGSYRAAQIAMRRAGITADSPVVFTGYSQGGLIAARLAASGDYRTAGLYTLGGPAGQVPVPHGIPYVALEHTEDLVPATGGTFASSRPVLVRRSLFDGQPPRSPLVFPAHQLARYRQTAALADASQNRRLLGALRELDGPRLSGTTVTSTFYRAVRTDR